MGKNLKVVLVAVACAPYGGSEGKVGWEGVLAISKFAQVHVITAAKYREEWNRAREENRIPPGVKVTFLGTGNGWHPNRMIARGQSWLRYLSFIKAVDDFLPRVIETEAPDLIHHLTYATWRVPTGLWRFPLPVIWGPVGGAGEVPKPFRSGLSQLARVMEVVRSWHGRRVLRGKKFKEAMKHVALVIAANEETKALLQTHRRGNPLELLPVAYLSEDKIREFRKPAGEVAQRPCAQQEVRLFAGGNIEGRKGVGFALKALAKAKQEGVNFHYTVAGGGPDIENLKILAARLGIADRVTFHAGFNGHEYVEQLKETDIFLMPSFRETLGMTCQEAILSGAYPLVADISAQGEMSRVAGVIGASVESEEALVADLAKGILDYYREPGKFQKIAMEGSVKLGHFFSQERYEKTLFKAYRFVVENYAAKPSNSFAGNER